MASYHGSPEVTQIIGNGYPRCDAQHDVVITAGANQAYTMVVLTLVDAADRAVLFQPFYFNARMAFQVGRGHVAGVEEVRGSSMVVLMKSIVPCSSGRYVSALQVVWWAAGMERGWRQGGEARGASQCWR
jgi:hypothetical protein